MMADAFEQVLGPTDPKEAPEGSLRSTIFKDWKSLGLAYQPNVGDSERHCKIAPGFSTYHPRETPLLPFLQMVCTRRRPPLRVSQSA